MHSVSYGAGGKIFLSEYAVPVCELSAKLGARGVSILFASGDHGVGAGDCKDDQGRVQFISTFPASCMCDVISLPTGGTHSQAQVADHIFAGPWVTSVGGTTRALPEVGVRISGGGFASYPSHLLSPCYLEAKLTNTVVLQTQTLDD